MQARPLPTRSAPPVQRPGLSPKTRQALLSLPHHDAAGVRRVGWLPGILLVALALVAGAAATAGAIAAIDRAIPLEEAL